MISFHVGQKVICVDASSRFIPGSIVNGIQVLPGMDGLEKDRIYTVREVGLFSWFDGEPCIRLEEIVRSGEDDPYWARRFKPVIQRETSIEIFKAMLNPSPVTVDAMTIADTAREFIR